MDAPTAPELLVAGNSDRLEPTINQYWGQTLGATLGFCVACTINWGTRRPVLSGIQQHIITTLLGAGIGYYVQTKREDYYARKDAILRHYIELHELDFPQPELKLIGDVLEPWAPIR